MKTAKERYEEIKLIKNSIPEGCEVRLWKNYDKKTYKIQRILCNYAVLYLLSWSAKRDAKEI